MRLLCANFGDAFLNRNLEPFGRFGVVIESFELDTIQFLVDRTFNITQLWFLVWGHKGECLTGAFGAGGAPNAVNVIFGHSGDVKVDDMLEGFNVDASSGNVSGNKHAVLARFEPGERFGALALRAVTVNAFGVDATFDQVFGQSVRPVLGARKHDHITDLIFLEHRHQEWGFQFLIDRIDRLRNAAGGCGLAFGIDRERVAQEFFGKLRDWSGHRRREKQSLFRCRNVAQDFANIRQETHVEHAIRLVQNQHLEPGKFGVRIGKMIEQSTRRGDDHIDTGLEGSSLCGHGHATEDGGGTNACTCGEQLELFLDLRGQLAGWRQDQGSSHTTWFVQQSLQNRQHEGGGLAASGHGATEHVAALERRWDGLRLNRCWGFVPHFLNSSEEFRVEREVGKGRIAQRHADQSFQRSTRLLQGGNHEPHKWVG